MDQLDRYQEELERRAAVRATIFKTETVQPRSDIRPTDYPVTIIGCIRGVDGWYRAGYDSKTKTIKPMQALDGSSPLLRERTEDQPHES